MERWGRAAPPPNSSLCLLLRAGSALTQGFELLIAEGVGEVSMATRYRRQCAPVGETGRVNVGNDPVGVEDVLHA
jgi:hypothetical protein